MYILIYMLVQICINIIFFHKVWQRFRYFCFRPTTLLFFSVFVCIVTNRITTFYINYSHKRLFRVLHKTLYIKSKCGCVVVAPTGCWCFWWWRWRHVWSHAYFRCLQVVGGCFTFDVFAARTNPFLWPEVNENVASERRARVARTQLKVYKFIIDNKRSDQSDRQANAYITSRSHPAAIDSRIC